MEKWKFFMAFAINYGTLAPSPFNCKIKFALSYGTLPFSNRVANSIWDLSRGDNNFAAIHDEGIGVGHRLKCGKAPSLRAFLTSRQRIYRYHHQACLREHQPV